MTDAFDAIIVGSGAGGADAAFRLAEAGLGGTKWCDPLANSPALLAPRR